jgi:hypothetical protein
MPTVAQHAENIAITSTLHSITGDQRHRPEQLYSDWEAYDSQSAEAWERTHVTDSDTDACGDGAGPHAITGHTSDRE